MNIYLDYSIDILNDGTMFENQYKILIDLLEQYKPKRICQLGSGQSTLIFEQYCKKYSAQLFSIEHDEKYKRENTILFPLKEYSALTIGERFYINCNKYVGFEDWLKEQEPFDFIFIDGPPGWGFREAYNYSRIQIVSFALLDKLNKNSIILYHDSERHNAQNTLSQFEKILKEKNITFQKNKDFSQWFKQMVWYKLM